MPRRTRVAARPRSLRRPVVALLAVLALVAGIAVGRASGDARSPDPGGSTLRTTWRDPTGSGVLAVEPGEPLRDRTDLLRGDARRDPPALGAVLGTVGQLTDTHVRDTASPARVPFVDRLGKPFNPIFRPQEPLTLQVLAAAARSVRRLRPDLAIVTGDLVDNDQQNELDRAIRALRGGLVRPFSARTLQSASQADPAYYRPDVDPPRMPGLLRRALVPFRSPGTGVPTLVVPGNHDLLVGGEVVPTPALRQVAVGDRRLVEPSQALVRSIPRDAAGAQAAVDRLLADGALRGRTAPVRADPSRRLMDPTEVVGRLHDAGLAGDRDGRADAVRDIGRGLRVVLLDDVPRQATDPGTVDVAQQAFLDRALASAGGRWVLVAFHDPLARTVNGRALEARIARDPRVVATIGGDTHHDVIRPVRTAVGGYWRITTSAIADWPQQGRGLRVRRTADGGAVLETWKLDTAPDPLADDARELAYLDAQGGRPGGNAGTALDRNVRLYVPPPR